MIHGEQAKPSENETIYSCIKCGKTFPTNGELEEHKATHGDQTMLTENVMKYSCINCGKTFQTNKKMKEHEVIHENQTKPTEYNCTKCDNAYVTMSKLRRHDWRSHREVDCSICGETLSSRQEIGCHRQNEHQLFWIANCKFFPNCIDENECFFKHDQDEVHGESNRSKYFCKGGENCSDQSCSVSEAKRNKGVLFANSKPTVTGLIVASSIMLKESLF